MHNLVLYFTITNQMKENSAYPFDFETQRFRLLLPP